MIMENKSEAEVVVETSTRDGKGAMPTKERRSWVVPTDTLVGDGGAKIAKGRSVKHGVGYGDFSTESWVSVSLTCNQDDDTLRKGAATAARIAETIISREDKRLSVIANKVAEELTRDDQK
jgi:hypothetical protein